MKTSAFLFPYDSLFEILQIIAKRKGYTITNANSREGIIMAQRRNHLFKKTRKLHFKIHKIDPHATGMKLMVNNNGEIYDRPVTQDEFEEHKMLDTIHKYF